MWWNWNDLDKKHGVLGTLFYTDSNFWGFHFIHRNRTAPGQKLSGERGHTGCNLHLRQLGSKRAFFLLVHLGSGLTLGVPHVQPGVWGNSMEKSKLQLWLEKWFIQVQIFVNVFTTRNLQPELWFIAVVRSPPSPPSWCQPDDCSPPMVCPKNSS